MIKLTVESPLFALSRSKKDFVSVALPIPNQNLEAAISIRVCPFSSPSCEWINLDDGQGIYIIGAPAEFVQLNVSPLLSMLRSQIREGIDSHSCKNTLIAISSFCSYILISSNCAVITASLNSTSLLYISSDSDLIYNASPVLAARMKSAVLQHEPCSLAGKQFYLPQGNFVRIGSSHGIRIKRSFRSFASLLAPSFSENILKRTEFSAAYVSLRDAIASSFMSTRPDAANETLVHEKQPGSLVDELLSWNNNGHSLPRRVPYLFAAVKSPRTTNYVTSILHQYFNLPSTRSNSISDNGIWDQSFETLFVLSVADLFIFWTADRLQEYGFPGHSSSHAYEVRCLCLHTVLSLFKL